MKKCVKLVISNEKCVLCTQKQLDNHLQGCTKTGIISLFWFSVRAENLQDIIPEVLSNATNSMEQDLLCNVKSFETNQETSHLPTNIPDRVRITQPPDLATSRSALSHPFSVRCTLTLLSNIWVLHNHSRYEI
jgi:hypothetical protein